MRDGVTIVDPASTTIDAGRRARPGHRRRARQLPARRDLGGRRLPDRPAHHADRRRARRRRRRCRTPTASTAQIGPTARRRPVRLPAPRHASLASGSKIGTFVEVKNSDVGAGAKVPHLSYIGDADVGEGTNLGAGTITANYDGARKHRTTIGARRAHGVDTTLVAPVELGDDAYTAAGSVITEDVPPGALGVARERQRNVEDYDDAQAAGRHDESCQDGRVDSTRP